MAGATRDTVAIVDDDDAVRHSLRFLLETVGYKVRTFATADEFLHAGLQDLACLILDHHMPEMTGLELAERLRADGVSMPIMLITGLPLSSLVTRAAELGIDKVLAKPLAEAEVIAFIDAAKG